MFQRIAPLVLAIAACGTSSPSTASPADAAAASAATGDASAPGTFDSGLPVVAEAGSSPSDAGGATGVTLQFASSAYTLYASIGGGPAHLVQLDTGSLGLYVPASAVGASATVSTTETCSITYVSSGNTLSGHRATASVTLLGSTKAGDVASPPATIAMPLCAVDDATFTGGVMGVGFGRGTAPDPTWNVLLQMEGVQGGTMHAGYVLSTHPAPSVQIGLTTAGAARFQTIALTASTSGDGDWIATSLHGCLALPKVSSFTQVCGPLLVDTGVADCLLWGPSDPTLGGVVPSGQTTVPGGTAIQIASPASGSILDYSFVVGSGVDTPAAVSVRTAGGFSINTGRALLVDYDYLFDAQAGLVGFRAAK